ncbi:MAG: DUF2298 domain-containing protein [Chloroflexia bacterium]
MGDAIVWWIALQLLGLAALPIGTILLRALPDRGYSVSKPLGLLLVGWLAYTLSMTRIFNFDRILLVLCLLLVAALSGFLLFRNDRALLNDLRDHFSTRQARTYVLVSELIFLIAFVAWAWVRAYNPAIVDQEKFMDFGFLNSILKSGTFPPNDVWLSGFSINYYYFGYILVAGLTSLSGVPTEVAFNLANVTLFALTALGSFGVVHNLITARLIVAGRTARREQRPVPRANRYPERPQRDRRYAAAPEPDYPPRRRASAPAEGEYPPRRRQSMPADRPASRRPQATAPVPASALPARRARTKPPVEEQLEEQIELQNETDTTPEITQQRPTGRRRRPISPEPVVEAEPLIEPEIETPADVAAPDTEAEAVTEVTQPDEALAEAATEESTESTEEAEEANDEQESEEAEQETADEPASQPTPTKPAQPRPTRQPSGDPAYLPSGPTGAEPRQIPAYLSPYIFAILAALMVVAMGNLTVAFGSKTGQQVNPPGEFVAGNGYTFCFFCNKADGYNWFSPSRIVADFTTQPNGVKQVTGFETINEFPAFSFLLADMHPHVLALPLVLLAISVAMAFARRRVVRAEEWKDGLPPGLEAWLSLAIAGLIAGSLYTANTWDFPTYLGVILLCLIIPYLATGRRLNLHARWLRPVVIQVALLGFFTFLLFLPFHLTFKSLVGGSPVTIPENVANIPLIGGIISKLAELVLINTADKTIFGFVVIFGVFLLSILIWLIYEFASFMRRKYAAGEDINRSLILWGAFLLLTFVAAFLLKFPLLALLLPIAIFGLGLVWLEPRRTERNFALILVSVGALIGLIVEVVFLRDNFQMRMNTLFKFYFQIWMLWALPAAYALWRVMYAALGDRTEAAEARRNGYYYETTPARIAGMAGASVLSLIMVFLVLTNSSYLYFGAVSRQGVGTSKELNLDGTAFWQSLAPDDLVIMQWLKANGTGADTVMEGSAAEYDYAGRMSSFSGVPSLLAWDNSHESLWRTNQPDAKTQIADRRRIINSLYQGQDPQGGTLTAPRLLELLKQYSVDYVMVGKVERGLRERDHNAAEDIAPYAEQLFSYALPVAVKSGDSILYSVGADVVANGAVPPTPNPNETPGETPQPTQPQADPSVTPIGIFANAGAGANRGQLNLPRGIARDAEGNYYVADTQNLRIQKFDKDGNWLLMFGSKGTGDGQFARLNDTAEGTGPGGIGVDSHGNVYVADTWNHRVEKFDKNGKFLLSFGGFINLSDEAAAADPAIDAKFYGPRGIAVGPGDKVYVTDTGNKRVLIFDTTGKPVGQISSDVTPAKLAQDYPYNKPGELNEPIGIAVDKSSNVYVADTRNQRIQKFGPDGAPLLQWPVAAPNWAVGAYLEPFLAVDAAGNVYASAPTGKTVLKYDPTGKVVGQKNAAGAQTLQLPTGIWADADGTVYVVDTTGSSVINLGQIP